MSVFEFRGFRTSLETEWVVANNSRVRNFRELLVDRGGLNANEARTLVERLINGGFDLFGEDYAGSMNADIQAIVRLRSDLRGRFQAVLELPPGHAQLPANLEPGVLGPLLGELETHLENVSGRSPTRAAADARRMSMDDFLRTFEGDESAARPGEPALTEAPLEGEGALLDDPLSRTGDPRVVAMVNERAAHLQGLLRRNGANWQVEVQPAAMRGREAGVAQGRGLSGLDPTFAGNGYEVVITTPWGERLEADGLRFIDDQHFEVLEWKNLNDNPYFSYLDRPEGFDKLKADVGKDARFFQELNALGCQGFVWMTNSAEISRAFEQAAAETHTRGVTFLGPE